MSKNAKILNMTERPQNALKTKKAKQSLKAKMSKMSKRPKKIDKKCLERPKRHERPKAK